MKPQKSNSHPGVRTNHTPNQSPAPERSPNKSTDTHDSPTKVEYEKPRHKDSTNSLDGFCFKAVFDKDKNVENAI